MGSQFHSTDSLTAPLLIKSGGYSDVSIHLDNYPLFFGVLAQHLR